MRVAFIGLGNMGGHMSRNLARAGVDLIVYDVRPASAGPAVAHGAALAATAADAASTADVVITMLPTPAVVEDVMLGSGGVLKALPDGAVWVDMSTSVPDVADRVRDQIGGRRIHILDAPVSGMSKGAEAGSLQIFVGGERADLDRVRPLFEIMGDAERVLHVGGAGAGYATKLLINLLWFVQLVGIAEALTIGVKAGVDLRVLHRSLVASPANSQLLEHDYLPLLRGGDYDEGFAIALACKDLGLAIDLARRAGVPVEASAVVEQIFRRARAQFGDLAGEMSPVRLYEQLAGTELRLDASPAAPTADAPTEAAPRADSEDADAAASQLSIGPFPPTRFGVGAVEALPGLLREGHHDTVLVVTDQGLRDTPVLRAVVQRLLDAGMRTEVFADVHPNPTTEDIEAGARAARQLGLDAVVVAVGGGSALDAAKGIALAATNPVAAQDLEWSVNLHPALPIFAAPTTSGTGAECNDFGVVTDCATHRKFYVGSPSCLAHGVVLDPALTLSLPPGPTAASGVDCLTHAVESYLSIRANPWADGLNLNVVRLVSNNLRRAFRDGSDLTARSDMLLAAHTAGQAMSTTGLGIVHGIGHPLGGRHDVPHGVALGLVLGECLRFNEPVRLARLADLAEPLGVHSPGASDARNAGATIAAVEQLLRDLSMPSALTDVSVGESDLAKIVDDALIDPVMANTPRRPTAADVHHILASAL